MRAKTLNELQQFDRNEDMRDTLKVSEDRTEHSWAVITNSPDDSNINCFRASNNNAWNIFLREIESDFYNYVGICEMNEDGSGTIYTQEDISGPGWSINYGSDFRAEKEDFYEWAEENLGNGIDGKFVYHDKTGGLPK